MKIGSIVEDKSIDKRISITPEISKKYINLGFKVQIIEKYGEHLGFEDSEYKELGVELINDEKKLIESSDVIVQMGLLNDNQLSYLKANQTYIGVLNSYINKDKLIELSKKNINLFSLELLPRITRAQSMDILSSQANLAGYKAVLESFSLFEKAIPMMMTAAGTVPAAKVLVIGAGVAGLQAIATAKRLGAIVSATDVRTTAKEQVESLGGKFLMVEGSENLETKGGYAKEGGEDFKKKQAQMLENAASKSDIIICTALIPGKPAPRILNDNVIQKMKPGSIVFDLAVTQGGNSAYSEVDKVVNKNGVKIIGISNVMNKLPLTASSLFAKNVFSFVRNLYSKEKKQFILNMEDEIIKSTLIQGRN